MIQKLNFKHVFFDCRNIERLAMFKSFDNPKITSLSELQATFIFSWKYCVYSLISLCYLPCNLLLFTFCRQFQKRHPVTQNCNILQLIYSNGKHFWTGTIFEAAFNTQVFNVIPTIWFVCITFTRCIFGLETLDWSIEKMEVSDDESELSPQY